MGFLSFLSSLHPRETTLTLPLTNPGEEETARQLEHMARTFPGLLRKDGGVLYPLSCRRKDKEFRVTVRPLPRDGVALGLASVRLTREEILTAMRVMTAQALQLHGKGWVPGSLSPEQYTLVRSRLGWMVYCALLTSSGQPTGHFLQDSPVSCPQDTGNAASPEAYRRRCGLAPAEQDASPEAETVFSLGCLFHLMLTGCFPRGIGRLQGAAAMLENLVPQPLPLVGGALGLLLRWMLSERAGDRPTLTRVLACLETPLSGGEAWSALPPLRRDEGSGWLRWREGKQLSVLWTLPAGDLPGPLQERFGPAVKERLKQLAGLEKKLRDCPGFLPMTLTEQGANRAAETPLPQRPMFPLSDLPALEKSPFLRDMRLVELAELLLALHRQGLMMGLMPPSSFALVQEEEGLGVCVTDRGDVFPQGSLPPPALIRLTPEALALLSPELHLALCRPEAFAGYVGPLSDVFSLGLLFHLMLTGELPRTEEQRSAGDSVFYRERTGDAVHLSDKLDSAHRQLILDMLALNPRQRPRGCAQVIRRILAIYTA